MKKLFISLLGFLIILASGVFAFYPAGIAKADWNSGNFISENIFANINALSVFEIQVFLASKGSYLKDFSENGRSAAQIIFDAAMGKGDATMEMNGISISTATGTINPQVILSTLQKEQSLITKTNRDDDALRKAMGFGCPDSGSCNPAYAGFTKQVENGAWQLRFSYERAQGRGFADYQVGQTMNFDSTNVFLANRAVSSLYRYTPHLNGNRNFATIFNNFFNIPFYGFSWQNQGPWTGPGAFGNPLAPGQKIEAAAYFKNTGSLDWKNNGYNPVTLGTAWPNDRFSSFVNGVRAARMEEATVPPGNIGSFKFTAFAPLTPGTYVEHFEPVIEGVKWMNTGLNWTFIVGDPLKDLAYVDQGPKTPDAKIHLRPGEKTTLWVKLRNLSGANWYNEDAHETNNVIHLGASQPRDRQSAFLTAGLNRGRMDERGVALGDIATFQIPITAPAQKGEYHEYFDPVVEGYGWKDTSLHWDIVVE